MVRNTTARHALSVLALPAVLATAACYTYVPASPTQPEPGTDVIAQLSDTGAQQLVTRLGPGVTEIGGMLLDREGESISMLVSWYRSSRAGDILSGQNEAVNLSFQDISSLRQKQLSKGKSVLLGIAFVGGAFLAYQAVEEAGRILSDEDEEEPDPIEIVLPLTRILRLPIW